MRYDFNNITEVAILGTSAEEVKQFRESCKRLDPNVSIYGELVWDGPVPSNSYMMVSPTMRMSTPEFFAFRKSNQMDAFEASTVVAELLSNVRTSRTCHSMEDGVFEDLAKLNGPRMGADDYRKYLLEVRDTPEGARALFVLEIAIAIVGDYEHTIRETLEECEG